MRRTLLFLLVFMALAASALLFGARRWQGLTRAAIDRLEAPPARPAAGRADSPATVYDESMLAGLPAPVVRYFRQVLRPGAPIPRLVRVRQTGAIRMGTADDSWKPFRATQVLRARPPAFVWDARVRMAPGLAVHVRDSYLDGRGAMRGEILGLIPVMVAEGGPDMAAASLQRWLAEATWFPIALLPDAPPAPGPGPPAEAGAPDGSHPGPAPGLRWSAIDDSTALATLADGATTVSLEFRFNAAGEIVSAWSPARAREVKGRFVPTPWEGRYSDYTEMEGMRIPARAEVAWVLPEGRLTYWRGRITGMTAGGRSR